LRDVGVGEVIDVGEFSHEFNSFSGLESRASRVLGDHADGLARTGGHGGFDAVAQRFTGFLVAGCDIVAEVENLRGDLHAQGVGLTEPGIHPDTQVCGRHRPLPPD
jgi:hypothetical protein